MKSLKLLLIPMVIAVSLSACSGTTTQDTTTATTNTTTAISRDIFAMDTYMNVKVYSDDETLLDDSESRITQLESLFAVNVEGSDLWNVNHANGETTTVSDDTAQTLSTALEVCKATNGALDVSIYPLLKAWGFTTGEYSVPTQETIDSLLANVDYSQVVLNGNDVTIPQNYEIDFGAVAKGYTSDSLIDNFRDNGVQSAIVNLGGNVQTLGTKPDGSLWNVAITNPFSPSEELGIVSIESKAVITSGNYERYFTDDDGNRYWHILDTSTGYPANNGLVSVTIVGDSGTMCDALSTALYVLGTDKAIQYWESNPNFGMVLVTDDKSIYITQDLTDTFQNLTDYNLEVLNYE